MNANKDWDEIKEKAEDAIAETLATDAADEANSSAEKAKQDSKATLPDHVKEVEDWQAEVEQLQKDNEQLKEDVENNHNKWLREVANSRTIQTRANKAVEEAQKFAIESFAKDLLQVLDSLDKALEHSDDEQAQGVLEGVELTAKMFADTLTKQGIEIVDPAGKAFDPQYHEALSMQVNPEVAPNTVITTIQKGYVLNSRLLRPARVIVAKA